MGVRGTDFITGFNPMTGATSLDVVSGRVAMVNIAEFRGLKMNPLVMDKLLMSPKTVFVSEGLRTKIPSKFENPEPPSPIPTQEMEEFKGRDEFMGSQTVMQAPPPPPRRPKPAENLKPIGEVIPPGVPKDEFVSKSSEIITTMGTELPPPPLPKEEPVYTPLDPLRPPPPELVLMDPNMENILDSTNNDIEGEIQDNFEQNSTFTRTRVIFKFN